jgi:hypothetical protein
MLASAAERSVALAVAGCDRLDLGTLRSHLAIELGPRLLPTGEPAPDTALEAHVECTGDRASLSVRSGDSQPVESSTDLGGVDPERLIALALVELFADIEDRTSSPTPDPPATAATSVSDHGSSPGATTPDGAAREASPAPGPEPKPGTDIVPDRPSPKEPERGQGSTLARTRIALSGGLLLPSDAHVLMLALAGDYAASPGLKFGLELGYGGATWDEGGSGSIDVSILSLAPTVSGCWRLGPWVPSVGVGLRYLRWRVTGVSMEPMYVATSSVLGQFAVRGITELDVLLIGALFARAQAAVDVPMARFQIHFREQTVFEESAFLVSGHAGLGLAF